MSVGFNDHDTLLALGVTPVAVCDWYGDYPYATWPWAQNELGDAQLAVLSSAELNIEAVAARDPDLIVGIFSGMTKREYELLSQIAPTVATPRDSTTSASAEAASCSGRAESTPVAGVTEGVVDAVDGGALVIVPGLLIDSHDAAEATSPRDGADPHPPLTGQPPQLGPQRLLLVPITDSTMLKPCDARRARIDCASASVGCGRRNCR